MKKLFAAALMIAAGSSAMTKQRRLRLGFGCVQRSTWRCPSSPGCHHQRHLGNPNLGITFGTSGCTQDGVVSSSWKISMFIDGTRVALARDAAAGQGENLDALAVVMGVKADDRAAFAAAIKSNFSTVFANENVAANLKDVLASNDRLSSYAAQI